VISNARKEMPDVIFVGFLEFVPLHQELMSRGIRPLHFGVFLAFPKYVNMLIKLQHNAGNKYGEY
jgi:hypothetical protein